MKFADISIFPVVFVACGLGLAAAGVAKAILMRQRKSADAVVVFICAAIAISIACVGSIEAGAIVTGGILCVGLAVQLFRSRGFSNSIAALAAPLRSQRLLWSAVGLCGLALIFFGFSTMDQSESLIDSTSARRFEEVPWANTRPAAMARSDCGSPIVLKCVADERDPERLRVWEEQILEDRHWHDTVIREMPANDDCNCHGWVFTGGRYWLGPDDVECILNENGYQSVTEPRIGDLVVYRQNQTNIVHTAVVRAVMDDGVPLVEGKWSWMGVYLHRVGDTTYGRDFTYYRTNRGSHILAGLPPSPASPPSRTD